MQFSDIGRAAEPLPSDGDHTGRSFGLTETENLAAVLASGTLTTTHGTFGKAFAAAASKRLGIGDVIPCNSGSAAIHAAVAAFDPEPGAEFIVSPLTDFGGVAPILWQGCIPVFADIDPVSYQTTADTIARCLSDRTAGIIVTHLFGAPAPVDDIVALAARHGVPVIEDCAQAYLTTLNGRPVGSFGRIATFSLQQSKHITSGEGGFVATSDQALAARMHRFINKARDYSDPWPDHHFLAMNYRMTELEAAVALAQLDRLAGTVAQRRATARRLDGMLAQSWLARAGDVDGAGHSFWRYSIVVSGDAPETVEDIAARLKAQGIAGAPHYKAPAYEWTMMRTQKTFGQSGYPFNLARPGALVAPGGLPGVTEGLARLLVLPWNERLTASDVDLIAASLLGEVQSRAAE